MNKARWRQESQVLVWAWTRSLYNVKKLTSLGLGFLVYRLRLITALTNSCFYQLAIATNMLHNK